jgi:hypothetical protein
MVYGQYLSSVEDMSNLDTQPEDCTYFIYPDYQGEKPNSVNYAKLSDWTAAGYLVGMCSNHQIEVTDTNTSIVNTSTGQVNISDETIVLFGGPLVNSPVHYCESRRLAPLYWSNSGGVNCFYKADGTRLDATALTSTQINNGQDMFTVESTIDDIGNRIMIIYGYSWKGTFAGGKFFKFIMYPNLNTYTDSYYVFNWTDSNGDDFVDLDEISTTPVTQG